MPATLTSDLVLLVATLSAVKAESAAAEPQDGDAQDQLRAVTDLLDQVGEQAETGEPIEMTGPARVVREALYGLLVDGADALAEACRQYESGAISLERLSDLGASAHARVELFAGFERDDMD